ncbi:putative L-lactate dehydrogenase operon regulatory protein [Clostridiales bacterium]|nr:putative L-lactate dehydrogenase operon regulatory protein [Clostridiales bacterium]
MSEQININKDFPYELISDGTEKITADHIVDRFKCMILDNKFPAGYMLPNENMFCKKFEISRSTLREAFKVLSSYGLITRTKHGTYVSDRKNFSSSVIIDYNFEASSVIELLEFRKIFEAESAYLAAQNATTDDIKELKKLLIYTEDCKNDSSELSRNDVKFHFMVACCTHNKLLISIMKLVSDAYYKSILSQFENIEWINNIPTLDATVYYHTSIFDAILLKDSEAAANAMRSHMDAVLEAAKKSNLI